MSLALYGLGLLALWVHAPPLSAVPYGEVLFALLAGTAIWQGAWTGCDLVRASVYLRSRFAKLRECVAATDPGQALPPHLYIVITSFRVPAKTTIRVFQAAIGEAIRFGKPVTIVVSLVEPADRRLIKLIFMMLVPPAAVRLVFVQRPAAGSLRALAAGLRAVVRLCPPPDAAVVVIRGDIVLERTVIVRTLPFLQGPLGYDLVRLEDRPRGAGGLFGFWLELRHVLRRLTMSSMALSGQLAGLSGGALIFRARLLGSSDPIAALEQRARDRAVSPAAEEVLRQVLTGPRSRLLYVPDVTVTRRFDDRSPSILASSRLIRRDARAVYDDLGRTLCSRWDLDAWFMEVRAVERPITLMLPLAAFVAMLGLAALGSWTIAIAYLLWLGLFRLVYVLALRSFASRVSAPWPLLIEYEQLFAGYVLLRTIVREALEDSLPHRAQFSCPRTIAPRVAPLPARQD